MSGRRGRLEVGRWLSLDDRDFHHRVSAAGSCEVLKNQIGMSLGVGDSVSTTKFFRQIIPKADRFRVGL